MGIVGGMWTEPWEAVEALGLGSTQSPDKNGSGAQPLLQFVRLPRSH